MNRAFNQLFGPVLERLPENNRLERIWVLAKVEFKKRYYHSILGLVWAILNPLFRLVVYYIIFTKVFNSRIENFALYLFSGLILWLFFVEATRKSFQIIRTKKYLLENTTVNKIDLFLASTLSAFIGFLFNVGVFLAFLFFSDVQLTIHAFWLPVIIVGMYFLVLGVSLILSTVYIFFTDLHQIWDMVGFAGRFASPIFIPVEIFYNDFWPLRFINPVAGPIINLHRTVIYGQSPDVPLFLYSLSYAAILLCIGFFVMNKYSYKALEKL